MPELRSAIAVATEALERAGVVGPDAVLLAAHALGTTAGDVRLRSARGDAIGGDEALALGALVARRGEREPLQHILGSAPFRHLELQVGPGVFVPRPETESLVDVALALVDASTSSAPTVVDAGSGSGAIALAIATERPAAHVVAVERSDDAIAWTARNVAAIAPRVALLHADLADLGTAVAPELAGAVDVLVSNPPYVPDDAVPRDAEVRLHDPHVALYGGADGLDVVRVLARLGILLVRDGGAIAIEHGELQGEGVRAALEAAGWRDAVTTPDLTGRDRVTAARR